MLRKIYKFLSLYLLCLKLHTETYQGNNTDGFHLFSMGGATPNFN